MYHCKLPRRRKLLYHCLTPSHPSHWWCKISPTSQWQPQSSLLSSTGIIPTRTNLVWPDSWKAFLLQTKASDKEPGRSSCGKGSQISSLTVAILPPNFSTAALCLETGLKISRMTRLVHPDNSLRAAVVDLCAL